MSKNALIPSLLVMSVVSVGLVYVGCEEQGTGKPSDQKEVAEGNKQNRTERQQEKKEKKQMPDPSELPVYKIKYPGTRKQLKKYEWTGNELDLIERNLNPHRVKLILPGGTTLKSTSRYTSFRLAENGIVWLTIHPLLEGVTYKEAADKMIDRINKWEVQLLENDKKELKEIKEEKEKSPRRKPAMISRTRLKGKLEEDDQYTLTFKLIGTRGKQGWFYNITLHLEQPLSDKIRGRKDPVYKIKVDNATDKEDAIYVSKNYNISVKIKDQNKKIIFKDEAGVVPGGYFHHFLGSSSHIEVPKVPENGNIHIQIKPDMKKENKTMEDFKYLPLDKTIPGKALTEGQTIHLKLKKNPDYKGK